MWWLRAQDGRDQRLLSSSRETMHIVGRGLRNQISSARSPRCMRQLDRVLMGGHELPPLFFLPQRCLLLILLPVQHQEGAAWHDEEVRVHHHRPALVQARYDERDVLCGESV